MLSTRSLHLLPDPAPLRKACQAIAALDAVLQPEWEFRYYTFHHKWGDGGRSLASMRDEGGDEYYLLFAPAGTVLKGFVPDAAMADPVNRGKGPWPGVMDELPQALRAELHADARFAADRATFCVWRLADDYGWRHGRIQFPPGPDPDGSEHLMRVLDGDPVTYARWAEQYYEIEIPFIEVRRVFMHRPMTEEIARSLNPQTDWGSLIEELDRIGYPIGQGA
ncbi:MAG TPA: hypothetical protein VF796_10595 [Humisphaera sp.]